MDDIAYEFETDPDDMQVEVAQDWYSWVKVCAARAVPFSELMGLHGSDFQLQEELDGLIIKLHAYILKDHLEPTTITRTKIVLFRRPATWWDHFKHTYKEFWWLPRWLKPAKLITVKRLVKFEVEVQPAHMFPEANVPQPSVLGRPFKVYAARVINDQSDNPGGTST